MKLSKLIFVMGLLALAGLFFSASQGHADFYKWVDKNGIIWLTDDPESLPEEARDQVEKVMTTEESSPSPSEGSTMSQDEGGELPAVGAYLENREQEREEIDKLKTKISTLEHDLAAARRALKRVSLTDRRGYWFVVDASGNRAPATYKDPGAVWSTQTWPAIPRSERTRESDERRRIQSDIEKFESELEAARKKLSVLPRSF
ncbi:MAG: DUF4124 domain-containing protein [Proteobacteria bacterium]|nr:DUF4124 domain-containing protein [Pseudomonadota bacterium]